MPRITTAALVLNLFKINVHFLNFIAFSQDPDLLKEEEYRKLTLLYPPLSELTERWEEEREKCLSALKSAGLVVGRLTEQ